MLEGYNQRGSLSLQEAQELGDQMQVEVQLKEEHALGLVSDPAADLRHVRGVVAIKKTGHNVYSCQIVVETTKTIPKSFSGFLSTLMEMMGLTSRRSSCYIRPYVIFAWSTLTRLVKFNLEYYNQDSSMYPKVFK